MTPAQLDRVPDRLLLKRDTTELLGWLNARGWQMTLFELDTERRRRNGRPVRKAT